MNSVKKRKALLQCSRQIYGIIISFIQDFQDIKKVLDISQLTEENRKKTEDYNDKIDYYKTQIGKFSLILMSDEWDEKTGLIYKEIITEHKNNLSLAKKEQNKWRKNMDGLFKVLFSRFCATKFNFFLILVAYFLLCPNKI